MTEAASTKVSSRARTVPQNWLDQNREDVLEPDLPIIDPHHHLWDFPMSRYQLDEMLADAGDGHNVRKTVFIECTSQWRADGPEEMRPVGETEYANGIAAMRASGDVVDRRPARPLARAATDPAQDICARLRPTGRGGAARGEAPRRADH